MKKLAFFLVFVSVVSASQAQPFLKRTNVLSAGIGFGGDLGSHSYGSQTPAFSVQFERGIWDIGGPGVISLGAYAGVKSYKYDGSGYWQKWNYTIVGVRGAYHYNGLEIDKLDLYGGAMVSFNILTYKTSSGYTSVNDYNSRPGVTGFVGARYFFVENLGVFAEAGYGVSYLTTGISLKF